MGVLVFLIIVISGAVPAIERRLREREQRRREVETLCLSCTNSLVMRSQRGNVFVTCNFGGAMRPLKIAVCECSGFRPKGPVAELVTIEGFIREEREVYAEIAVSK